MYEEGLESNLSNVYNNADSLLDNDEITPEEECFMYGYIHTEEEEAGI